MPWSSKLTIAPLLLLLFAGVSSCETGESSAAVQSSNDARLTDFLQKHFRIPDASSIKLSAPTKAPIAGLVTRNLTVVNDKGSATVTLYADAGGQRMIIGQLLDLDSDPWGRLDTSKLHLSDRPSLGPPNAPITMVEFADFECPHCARALDTVETAVRTTYKGEIHLIYKDFPLNGHLWARPGAIAAECVRLQNPDAFWSFAEMLYHNQATIDPTNFRSQIDQFVTEQKLDPAAFNACLMGHQAEARVNEDVSDGELVNVNSTPTILINGIPILGDPDDKTLAFVINAELHKLKAEVRHG